jgi:CRISPR/Cas system-associated exonuclease Cas4 (RecB family)
VGLPARPPPNKRDYFSYSSIRTYQRCPLQYYFRYEAGLPEETVSASLVFGGAIHLAIEHHFRELLAGNPPPALDALLAKYQAGWREWQVSEVRFGKEETRQSLDALAARMLAKFRASSLAKPGGRILAVEETLRGEFVPRLPDLLGRVDLIVERDDALVVADWKTSRARWSAEQVEEASDQVLCYSSLAGDFAPGKPIRLEFSVLTKAKDVVVERHVVPASTGRQGRVRRVVERVWRAIEAGHFYPSPSPMNCSGCPFRTPCRNWRG